MKASATSKNKNKKSKSTNSQKVTKKEIAQEHIVAKAPSAGSLRKWNLWLAGLHAAQAIAILVISASHSFAVATTYLTKDVLASAANGHPVLAAATRHLFDVNMAYLIAAFFFMSALAHFLTATVCRPRYETDLKRGINKVRWIEYGFSASTMLVAIGLLSGISDLSTLFLLFAAGLVMNLMGLAMEVYNQNREGKPNWLAYVIGCIAGIAPWVVFSIYLFGAVAYGEGGIPGFVWGIYASLFVLFNCFALNMWLQYRGRGKWANYLYGERVYMILSLVAKTVLAWQVFAGALRP